MAERLEAYRDDELRKNKRMLYGAYYTLPTGRRIYLAHRVLKDFFLNGRSSRKAAEIEGVLEWCLDYDHFLMFQRMGLSALGVLLVDGSKTLPRVRRRAWVYIAPIEKWVKHAHQGYFANRKPQIQWHMNVQHLDVHPGIFVLK